MNSGTGEVAPSGLDVLIIEDNIADQLILKEHLQTHVSYRYDITCVKTLAEARSRISDKNFGIILIDVHLPDGQGTDFIFAMKDKITTPFVVLTNSKDIEIERAILASGASDFIPKNELTATFLERVIAFAIERNRVNTLLQKQALIDTLTGLHNRLGMEKLFANAVEASHKSGHSFALLLVDLDNFKTINDTYGNTAGDEILRLVASKIEVSVDIFNLEADIVRMGADEFALLIANCDQPEDLIPVLRDLTESLTGELQVDGYEIALSSSIGVAIYPEDGKDRNELVSSADFSLFQAKKQVGGAFEFFDQKKLKEVQKKNFIEKNIANAIKSSQFMLCYQPKFITNKQKLYGCEALIRWDHPEKGTIWPGEFIHITEKTGHILAIGEWVLREACRQCVSWQKAGLHNFSISVNVSIRQLLHVTFVETVRRSLVDTGLKPECLELEITETLVIDNLHKSIEILNELREMGVCISIDDFGTGYSSLARLRRLPVNKLKIDRSLIRKVGKNRFDTAIAKTVLTLAKNLSLTAVAEGVETEEQFRFLKNASCPEVQGYYFSRPLSAQDFETKYIS